jgi:RimJ/RimL family protein N-acetyltransferase
MLKLIPITEDLFEVYWMYIVQAFAQDNIQVGRWSEEEAQAQAEKELGHFLPQGLETPNHYISVIVDDETGQKVGMIWFDISKQGRAVFGNIYNVEIFQEFRRHGYGTRALELMESQARELGATAVGLRIFGHNKSTVELYQKMGYEAVHFRMVKILK